MSSVERDILEIMEDVLNKLALLDERIKRVELNSSPKTDEELRQWAMEQEVNLAHLNNNSGVSYNLYYDIGKCATKIVNFVKTGYA